MQQIRAIVILSALEMHMSIVVPETDWRCINSILPPRHRQQRHQHQLPIQAQHQLPIQAQHQLPIQAQHQLPLQAQHQLPIQAQHQLPIQAQHQLPIQAQHQLPIQAQHQLPLLLLAGHIKDAILTEPMDASLMINYLITQPSLSSHVFRPVLQPATQLPEWSSAPNASVVMSFTMVERFHQIKEIAICNAEGMRPKYVAQETGCPCIPLELHRSFNRRDLS